MPGDKPSTLIQELNRLCQTNACSNPGLEVDTTGWSTFGANPPTIARDTSNQRTGSGCLSVTWATASGLFGPQFTASGLTVGTTYVFGGWVKVASGPNVAILMAGVGFGGQTGSASYAFISGQFTATATTQLCQFCTSSATTAGQQCYIDDVIVFSGGTGSLTSDRTGAYPLGNALLSATAAANVWAGTSGLDLQHALNVKAGNTAGVNMRDVNGACAQIAGASVTTEAVTHLQSL